MMHLGLIFKNKIVGTHHHHLSINIEKSRREKYENSNRKFSAPPPKKDIERLSKLQLLTTHNCDD